MSKKFLSPIKLAQGTTNPTTGSSGELFFNTTDLKVYAHNGTSWLPSGGGVTASATPPTSPVEGDAWYDTDEGTLFIRFDGFWVEASNTVQNAEPNQVPAGAMMAWGSSVIPNNWLLCDGAAISRTTYASLFAAIGVTYGAGDGTTTFNTPNLKGRVVAGLDSAQTEFNTLGETGGAKTHTLLVTEMPSHTHVQNSHTHTFSGSTSTTGAHTHSLSGKVNISQNGYGQNSPINGNAGNFADGTAYSAGDHAHTFSGTTSSQSVSTNQNTGGDGAHNNLQPYIVLNYIIKYSAGETPGDSQLATRVGTLEGTGYRLAQTVYFTSSSTFSKSSYPWLRAVKVRLVGGGGGGGSTINPATGANAAGNGGGGGCYAEEFITNIASLAASITVTVGAGGTGGTAATNNAGSGGTSSFGSLCSGTGGAPGNYGASSTSVNINFPNDSFTSRGGTTGIGDLVISGGQGGYGFMSGGNGNSMGGAGGSSFMAGEIAITGYPGSGSYFRNGPTGQNYGGGGGGGASLQAAGTSTGGAGAPGIVIVELYA